MDVITFYHFPLIKKLIGFFSICSSPITLFKNIHVFVDFPSKEMRQFKIVNKAVFVAFIVSSTGSCYH